MLQALGIAILTEAFPPTERGKALGIGGTTVSIGIALGPSLGGLLIGEFGWRSIFLVNVPVGIMGIILAWSFVPNTQPKGRQRFDFVGAALMSLTLLSFSVGMTLSQDAGFANVFVIGLLAIALAGLVAFIRVERRVTQPMIRLGLFRNLLFSINLYAGVSVFIVVASVFLFPFYLEYVHGHKIQQIGLMMASFPIMLGILAPLSGSLSDRWGTRRIAVIGLIVATLACIGLSTLNEHTTTLGFVLRLTLLGAGIGIFQSPNNSAVMGSVAKNQLGIASGLLATTRNVGQAVGVPILGTVFALAGQSGKVADLPPHIIVDGLQAAFLFAAGVLFLAMLVYLYSIRLERA